MFWLKGCPRCSGNLYSDCDQFGTFVACLQCSLNRDMSNKQGASLVVSAEPTPIPVSAESMGPKRQRISHGGRHFARTFAFGQDTQAQSAA